MTAGTPRPGNHGQRISERYWPADMAPGGMPPGGPRRAPVLHIETVGGSEIIVPRQEAADAPAADDGGQAAELAALAELGNATAALAVDTSELCREEFGRLGGQLTSSLELLKRLSQLSAMTAERLAALEARVTVLEHADCPDTPAHRNLTLAEPPPDPFYGSDADPGAPQYGDES